MKTRIFPPVGMSNGHKILQTYAVIDPRDMEELVGGNGWEILHVFDQNETQCGSIYSMVSCTFLRVDTAPAIEYNKGQVLLLSIGG